MNTVAATGNNSTTGNQYASNTGTDEFGISDAVIENFMKTHGDGGTGNTGNTVVGNTITGNLSAENDYFDRAAAEQVLHPSMQKELPQASLHSSGQKTCTTLLYRDAMK